MVNTFLVFTGAVITEINLINVPGWEGELFQRLGSSHVLMRSPWSLSSARDDENCSQSMEDGVLRVSISFLFLTRQTDSIEIRNKRISLTFNFSIRIVEEYCQSRWNFELFDSPAVAWFARMWNRSTFDRQVTPTSPLIRNVASSGNFAKRYKSEVEIESQVVFLAGYLCIPFP